MKMEKTNFPIDKRKWSPSLIPGNLVLVSTCCAEGKPNVAPKSWVQMVAFDPPTLMFSGTKGNTSENNILATEDFGVNIVDSSMAEKVYDCLQWYGAERIEKMGLTLKKASKIKASLVDECRAHLECRLVGTKEVGTGFILFGEIVAASLAQNIEQAAPGQKYGLLDQVLFLENQLYASVSKTVKTGLK